MNFVGADEPVSERELQHLEERIGLEIPQELRQHYLHLNGGTPVPNAFIIDEDYFKIQQFLRIDDTDDGGVEATFIHFLTSDALPKGYIPFAVDSAGDYFLCAASENVGAVYFYQSDYYDDPSRALVFLAPSFSDFMAQLQYDD